MTEAAHPDLVVAHCDGGSRGNPGPSGYGVVVEDARGRTIAELSEFLGVKTNNFAEYSGLLAALEYALRHGHSRLRVVADSELMVKQMKGQYRVNSPDLRPLWEEAKRRVAGLERFEIQHVLRGKNKGADRLANLAMDRGTGRTVREVGVHEIGTRDNGAREPVASTASVRRPGPATASLFSRPLSGSFAGSSAGPTAVPSALPKSAATLPMQTVLSEAKPRTLKGFVKNGVVHLLEGELPENCFVRVTPE